VTSEAVATAEQQQPEDTAENGELAPEPPLPRRDLKPKPAFEDTQPQQMLDDSSSSPPQRASEQHAPPPLPPGRSAAVAGRAPPAAGTQPPPAGARPAHLGRPSSRKASAKVKAAKPAAGVSIADGDDDDDDDDDDEEEEEFEDDDDDVTDGDDVDAALRRKVSTTLEQKVSRGVITEAERMHIAAVAEALAAGLERSPSPKLSLAEPEPREADSVEG
jgi:hypothetical protein